MEVIFLILALVWSILCLILFFKVWGMTNDVSAIRQYLCDKNVGEALVPVEQKANTTYGMNDNAEIFRVGDKVIHKDTKKELTIVDITNEGKAALCSGNNGEITYYLNSLKKK